MSASPTPRVALVHDWLTGMRGGEKVLEAIAAIYPQAPIFTLFHFPGSVSETLEAHPIHTSFLQRVPGLRNRYRQLLPLFPSAIEDFDLSGFDLIVSTSHCVAKGIVPPPGSFHLCYCHTPMRYAWDQEHAYFPKRTGLVARLRSLALSRLRSWDVAASARVDLFVANSRFVAERIRRYYDRDAAVLNPPVDIDFYTPRVASERIAEPEAPYALVVTALAPYKRVDLAIAACGRLGLELRIVGDGPERRALERQGAASGAPVQFLGRVVGERLRDLYRDALCLLQPGVEDFGIVPVEALACGTPVVALGRGGVLDVVESGEHGVLYEPPAAENASTEAESLAAAIDKSRQIRFNPLNLRQRAASFSPLHFDRELRRLLETRPNDETLLRSTGGLAP